MTPEVYLMQCDGDECERYLPSGFRTGDSTTVRRSESDFFQSRKAARTNAALRGWYIGDEELCPKCAAKRGKHGNA